ncbi:hypothetical protein KJ810_02320 [Patescibacteria group bacterium]|nr:hypothetical protein [Patescibacteria group bacterium]
MNYKTRSSAIKRHILVILLFIVLTVITTYPLAGHLNNWVHDGADPYFITWTLAWDVHAFQENITNIFNANIFYPNENTLAYSEHIIGTAVLAWPIIALTSNPILAYNLVTLLFFVLAAYCMYLFLYYLTKNSAVSIIGAIIFGFNPFRVVHFSQIHLQVIFFFPLMLLILHRLVDSKKNRNFIYLIIAYISLGYMSSHYFLMMAIVIATFIIFYFAAIKKRFPEKQFVFKFALSLLVIFLAVFPVLYPYLLVHDESGYVRSYGLIEYYSPDIVDYLTFSPFVAEIIGNPNNMEKVLYTGFTVLILFIVSICIIVKRRIQNQKTVYISSLYILIGIICFMLSFGVMVNFSNTDAGIAGPYVLLYKFVPGFDGLRALGRFFVVVLLSISVIIGLGLNQLLKRIKKRYLYGGTVILVSSLLMLEFLWIPPFQPVPYREVLVDEKVPEVYRWLADQEGDPVILELPLDSNIVKTAEYVYMSTYHWKKMFNGYSGFFPENFLELEDDIMLNFTSPETQSRISGYGINYVIVHFDVQSQFIMQTTPEGLDQLPSLELIEQFGNDYVYQLK